MRKNKVIALILAVFLPGLGHIYVGLIKKGILVLLLFPFVVAVDLFAVEPILDNLLPKNILGEIIFLVLSPILWFYVWQIREVYLKATSYSDFDKRKVKIKK